MLTVCYSRLCLFFGVSKICVSTLEKYESLSTGDRKRVASIASPALTLKTRNSQFDTSVWCRPPGARSGNFGQKYLSSRKTKCQNRRGEFAQVQVGERARISNAHSRYAESQNALEKNGISGRKYLVGNYRGN